MKSKVPVKCAGHGNLLAKYILPCEEYPNGAFEILKKCHGVRCETVFTIPAPDVAGKKK